MSEFPHKSPAEHASLRNRLLAVGAAIVAAAGIAGDQTVSHHDASPAPTPIARTHNHSAHTFDQFTASLPETPTAEATKHVATHESTTPTPTNHPSTNKPQAKPEVHIGTPLKVSSEQPAPHSPKHKAKVQHHTPKHHHSPKHETTPKPHPNTMPTMVIPTDETLPAPEQPMNLHPENLSIPAEVSKVMHENVTYLPALGCSGFLVRDAAGEPIGTWTAQHCNLLQKNGHWDNYASEGSQSTINFFSTLGVRTGDSMSDLSLVNDIDQFVLNAPDDMTKDQAFGVFPGHTAQEVLANNNQMSADEIANLKTGDVIYNSGWPVNQPGNAGMLERQEFAMSVLGTDTVTVTTGQQLKVLLAAVPETKDGAECSWGNSGSVAFTPGEGGTPRIIGTASMFNDFGLLYNKDKPDDAAAVRTYIENKFGVSMDGFAGVCGFAYESPSPDNGMVVAKAMAPVDFELTPLGKLEKQFTKDFFDPTIKRHVIDGLVQFNGGKGSFVVDRPLITYDAASNIALVGWYASETSSNLVMQAYYGNDGLSSLKVYQHGDNPPSMIDSVGEVTANNDKREFTDAQGLEFGMPLDIDQPSTTTVDNIVIKDGQVSLEPVTKDTGETPAEPTPAG